MASKPTGKPNGRPTKYDPKIHPGIVAKLAATGMTDEDIAEVLTIDTATFYRWKVAHPEFSEAVAKGKSTPIAVVEDSLYRLCNGYTYKEGSSRGIRVEKTKHPDVRAIEFYLKNVAPDKWRDKRQMEDSVPDGGPIVQDDLAGMTNEELEERMRILRAGDDKDDQDK